MICIPVVARSNAQALELLALAAAEPADCYELRLDILEEEPDLPRLLRAADKPVIATVRSREQGGEFAGGREERLALLQQAVDLGAAYVDAEEDVVDDLRRGNGAAIIIASWHDWRETPDDLPAVVARLAATRADWIKFAVTPRTLSDNFRVLAALRSSPKPAIGIAMGEAGLMTRILGPAHGSRLTFGTLAAGRESAPGQPTARQLAEVYRLRSITRDTAVYGLAGNPVAKSIGYLHHNRAFAALGIDAVYIPFLCRDLRDFVRDAHECINLRGLSVTMPLKPDALALADTRDDTAVQTGAANTLTREPHGWNARNTDFTAVADGVAAAAATAGIRLADRPALLLGTGGAARGIGCALASLGCAVAVTGRASAKAAALANERGWRTVAWDDRGNGDWAVVANSTPVGMSPDIDSTPYPAEGWAARMIAFDAVYHPRETRFLREARAGGAIAVDGVDMFERQALEQFRLWTGREIPLEIRTIKSL